MSPAVHEARFAQQLEALALAQSVRAARKQIREQLRRCGSRDEGLLLVAALIAKQPQAVAGMAVMRLLTFCPGIHETKARKILRAADIWEMAFVRQLTGSKRSRLVLELVKRADAVRAVREARELKEVAG